MLFLKRHGVNTTNDTYGIDVDSMSRRDDSQCGLSPRRWHLQWSPEQGSGHWLRGYAVETSYLIAGADAQTTTATRASTDRPMDQRLALGTDYHGSAA